MSDALSVFKDAFLPGKINFLICFILFLVAIALLLCGLISPCLAGAIIFIGLALCCCSAC
ncbi:MAG: hypothetical protein M1130_13850 [Actinobacteria bacterium]|nr:hypothetical protein [Actinomycetota bacterium]